MLFRQFAARGEICWMLHEPIVPIDGFRLWYKGRLMPNTLAKTEQFIKRWPELAPLFKKQCIYRFAPIRKPFI